MKILISKELQPIVRVAVAAYRGLEAPPDGGEKIWRHLNETGAWYAGKYAGTNISEIAGIQDARRFYRAIGVDPTKTRPSSEALLRRCLKGKGLYRIHPLVDVFNLVSLRYLLPVGLYDQSKIIGDTVTIRIGAEGWGFDGIRKGRVNVSGRMCIADESGPFGSPTSDSARTGIEGRVTDALVLLYQSADGVSVHLEEALQFSNEWITDQFQGVCVHSCILSPAQSIGAFSHE